MARNLQGRLVTVNLNDDVLDAIAALEKRRGVTNARSEILRAAALEYCARELSRPREEDLQTSVPVEEDGP